MYRNRLFRAALLCSMVALSPTLAAAQAPLEVLYLTDYSAFWHDYDAQSDRIIEELTSRVNARVTLVGKSQGDTLGTLDTDGFAAGYDAVVANFCLPREADLDRVANLIRQTEVRGVPMVLLHCAMHSFQSTSPSSSWQGNLFGDWGLRRRVSRWEQDNPGEPFPYYWQFTGVDTVSHDIARALTAVRVQDHPAVRGLPERFRTPSDELYRARRTTDDIEVLYEVDDEPVVWTRQAGAGRVFATTLGHDSRTQDLPVYHDLVARGLLWATGRLADDGTPLPGYEGNELFVNYQDTVRCNPSDIVEPRNVAEVQAAVQRAIAEGKRVKAVSVVASNSNSRFICPEQGGLLLNLWQMDEVVAFDEQAQLVTVQPGLRLHYLSQWLAERGYAITTMPDYTGVSVAGGMATGAHNSSLAFANSIADLAEEMTVVDGQGRVRVLRGDELATGAVHLGLLGIVVEVKLRVVPQFKLRYGYDSGSDEGLEDDIEQLVRAHDYAKVMWFAGNGRYVVDYYDRVPMETPGESRHNLWSSTAGIFKTLGDTPYRVLNALPQRAQCDAELLRARLWQKPIDAQGSPSNAPVGFSHEILASYCEPGDCPWDGRNVQTRTMEVAFPVSRLREWMADVRQVLAARRGCFPVLGLYLRFSAASDRALGLNQGHDSVSFEIHVPKDATETTLEPSTGVYDEIVQMTLDRYDGRPHWGKNSSAVFAGLGEAQYPAWQSFLALKNQLDPAGLFENELWWSVVDGAPPVPYAGCALSRSCTCERDLHCGSDHECVEGGYFEQARVCR